MTKLKVFDENKLIELNKYDLNKGYLKEDKLFIIHHEAVSEVKEVGHYEVVKEYPNGGRDVKWIVDIPETEAKEAWDEYEDIQIYIPYTAEEIEKKKEEQYPVLVEQYIRERYSLSAELAILRQRDSKPEEFNEYNNYAENCKLKAKAKIEEQYI
jgi:hypothetical protein